MKALEYKECFTHIAFKKMTKSLQNIQLFLDIQYRMFGQAVSINYDCFGLCNVLTALDPPFERLFCEDFNGGFCFKGG
jgi:hypothetical protein